MKRTVHGTMHVDFTATIDSEDDNDAENIIDSVDVCLDCTDGDITFTYASQCHVEVDSISCDAEEQWKSLSKMERMEVLIGNNVSDDAAYDMAGEEFSDIPDEWQEFFD